ncbi:MAG: cystathionine gamma-synthase family protein [Chlorobi bacterium]|nr:cystathionine gamma-synthase family protein [Chlorobiota bacterium]
MPKDKRARKFKHPITIDGHVLRPESLMMSYGYNPEWSEGALKCPIFQTSTFVFKTAEEGKRFFEIAYGLREKEVDEKIGLIYSRLNNPDLEILEDRLTLWDQAENAAVFESGMAAITTSLLSFLKPGDVILHSTPLYGGTEFLIENILPKFNIDHHHFYARDQYIRLPELAEQYGSRVKIIYIETPANPTNDLIDIEFCADIAEQLSEKRGEPVYLFVDNTFLGPLWQQPLRHGADLVIYSATKFIGGHSDVVAGAVVGPEEIVDTIKFHRSIMGTMAGPWTGWLLMRSLETLKLRMTAQMKNARYVARFLDEHPMVEKVYYLDLLPEDSEQFKIYRKQCTAPGSIISFDIHGGEKEAFKFLNSLKLIKLAVSLGSTESLAEHPATMTHADIPPEKQREMGITEKMIRLSIGVENPEDIIKDIEQALEQAFKG